MTFITTESGYKRLRLINQTLIKTFHLYFIKPWISIITFVSCPAEPKTPSTPISNVDPTATTLSSIPSNTPTATTTKYKQGKQFELRIRGVEISPHIATSGGSGGHSKTNVDFTGRRRPLPADSADLWVVHSDDLDAVSRGGHRGQSPSIALRNGRRGANVDSEFTHTY